MFAPSAPRSPPRTNRDPGPMARRTGQAPGAPGTPDEAERLGREAVELSRHEEDPIDQANALMDLGEVLRIAGRPDEASLAGAEALALYERKGNLVSAAAARHSSLTSIGGPEAAGRPSGALKAGQMDGPARLPTLLRIDLRIARRGEDAGAGRCACSISCRSRRPDVALLAVGQKTREEAQDQRGGFPTELFEWHVGSPADVVLPDALRDRAETHTMVFGAVPSYSKVSTPLTSAGPPPAHPSPAMSGPKETPENVPVADLGRRRTLSRS